MPTPDRVLGLALKTCNICSGALMTADVCCVAVGKCSQIIVGRSNGYVCLWPDIESDKSVSFTHALVQDAVSCVLLCTNNTDIVVSVHVNNKICGWSVSERNLLYHFTSSDCAQSKSFVEYTNMLCQKL
jgi:WD40 repeat protein